MERNGKVLYVGGGQYIYETKIDGQLMTHIISGQGQLNMFLKLSPERKAEILRKEKRHAERKRQLLANFVKEARTL